MSGSDERDREIGGLFASARVEPTVDERRRLLAAATPILARHARKTMRRAGAGATSRTGADVPAPWTDRLRAFLTPRRALALAFTAAALAAVLLQPWPAAERETRSAAVVTWIEHEQTNSRPFPLASASFGRAY